MRRHSMALKRILVALGALALFSVALLGVRAQDGPSWQQMPSPAEVRQIVDVADSKGHLFLASAQGVFESMDGGITWAPKNDGLTEIDIVGLITPDHSPSADSVPLWAATASGAIYWSEDGANAWQLLGSIDDPPFTGLAVVMGESTEMWFSSTQESVRQELDGYQWREIPAGVEKPIITSLWGDPDRYYDVYVGAGPHLYRLPPPGFAWQQVTDAPLRGQVVSLSSDPLDLTRLLVGTRQGGVYTLDLESQDITELSGALPSQVDVLDLTRVEDNRGPWLVAATSAGVFRSPDDGESWLISGPPFLSDGSVTCLAVDDNVPQILLMGTTTHGVVRGDFRQGFPRNRLWAIIMACAGLVGLLGIATLVNIRPTNRMATRDAKTGLKLDQWEAWNERIGRELQEHLMVTSQMLETIPSQVRTLAMRRYIDTHRHQDIILTQEPLAIEPARRIELDILANNWNALLESLPSEENAAVVASRIVDQLCELLGFTPLNHQVYRSIIGVMVEAPTIRLSLPRQFPIMVVLHPEPTPADVRDMRDMSRMLGATSFFALAIVPNATPHTVEQKRDLMSTVRSDADDFELLDYQDLVLLYMASNPPRELARMIVSQIDLTQVSPYVIWGPVPKNMFFGRSYEIRAIMQAIPAKSFALVGGRKIGKTSVLAQVGELVKGTRGLSALHIDCQHVDNYHAFFEALSVVAGLEVSAETPDELRRVIVRLRHLHGGDQLVLILDEVGRLLAYDSDRGMQLFEAFRSFSREGLVSFLFCGERVLNRALHNPASPLFHYCESARLGYLGKDAVRRMVLEPMLNLGLSVENAEALTQGMAELSACHPNLVQYICQQLVLQACRRDDRLVHLYDLQTVRESQSFREFMFEIIWGDATTLEKLITVVMADKAQFARDEVALALQQLGCVIPGDQLDESLYELCLLAILSRDHDRYTYRAEPLATLMLEAGLQRMFADSLVTALGHEQTAEAV